MAAEQTPGTPEPVAAPPGPRAPLADRMRDAGWDPSDTSTPDPAAANEPVVAPKKGAKPKPAKVEAADPGEPKPDDETEKPPADEKADADKLGARGLLEKLAKEQGFVLEEGKLRTKELAEFRLLKKAERERLVTAEKEAIGRIEEANKGLAERYAKVEAFEAALKGRDHNALAKVGGYESWDKLQEEIVKWNQDPNYQEMQEIKAWKKKQEEEAERAAQQRQQQQAQAEQQQREVAYLGNLSATMKGSTDPLVQSMAEDPLFVRAVYRIQQENWDGRETVTPEQAARMAASGSRVTLVEELKALHGRLDKAFGKKPEPEKPPAPKPKIAGGPKAAPSTGGKFESRNARMRNYADRLAEATERDRKAGGLY